MQNLMEYIPFLIPIIILDLVFRLSALIHVLRHPCYRFGNRIVWVCIVLLFTIIGPILYFSVGRGES